MLRNKSWDDGWLTAFYGKEDRRDTSKDIVFGSPCKADGSLLHTAFQCTDIHGKTLIKHLEERGYDIATLQFSIKRKWKPNQKPAETNEGNKG